MLLLFQPVVFMTAVASSAGRKDQGADILASSQMFFLVIAFSMSAALLFLLYSTKQKLTHLVNIND